MLRLGTAKLFTVAENSLQDEKYKTNFYYHQYPMDTQQCEFRMSSSNFGRNLIFKLMEGVIHFPTDGEKALHDFDAKIMFFDTSGKYLD